jgi:hypothetical protein
LWENISGKTGGNRTDALRQPADWSAPSVSNVFLIYHQVVSLLFRQLDYHSNSQDTVK